MVKIGYISNDVDVDYLRVGIMSIISEHSTKYIDPIRGYKKWDGKLVKEDDESRGLLGKSKRKIKKL